MGHFIYEKINGLVVGKTDDTKVNDGLFYGFSTRNGGVSEGALSSLNLGVNRPDTKEHLIENYNIFSKALGIESESIVLPKQVHSDIILKVSKKDCGKRLHIPSDLPDCDGLITTDSSVALGIFYADCTPVLLYDSKVHCLCLVHCGWRGTVKGFAKTGVITMINEFGCRPENIHAVIGPCIGICHFEVGEEVAEEFKKASMQEFVREGKSEGKFFADLKGANKKFLQQAGVEEENITVSEDCTVCDTKTFFSHRGCGEDTGRMAVIAKLK